MARRAAVSKIDLAVPSCPASASLGGGVERKVFAVETLPSEAAEPVFVLTLPLKLDQGYAKSGKPKPPLIICPTLNEYNGMPGWLKKKVREAVDFKIADVFAQGDVGAGAWLLLIAGSNPGLRCQKRRRVVVTRHSSREPDELAVDVIGGKIPIDRLVKLGILAGDSRKWLEREAHWEYAKPGAGKLVVEVYDI